jgi:hypothetical protein
LINQSQGAQIYNIKNRKIMSGGAFDYNQHKIGYIIEEIEEVINDNGREKTEEELKEESWRDPDWYEKYPEDLFHYKYPDEVIEKMKEGIEVLKRAQIYAQRIDWLLSGDDGEESFLKRLEEDLNELEK